MWKRSRQSMCKGSEGKKGHRVTWLVISAVRGERLKVKLGRQAETGLGGALCVPVTGS